MLSFIQGKQAPHFLFPSQAPCALFLPQFCSFCSCHLDINFLFSNFPKSKQSWFSLEEHMKALLLHKVFSYPPHWKFSLFLRIPQPLHSLSFMTLAHLNLVLWLCMCKCYFLYYTTKVFRIIFLSELSQ